MWSKALGALGRTLITAGVLVLLFVVYELWGTGLQEARSQRALRSQFAQVLREAGRPSAITTGTTATTAALGTPGAGTQVQVVPTAAALPTVRLPAYGAPLATIRVPKIGLTRTVVQGVGLDQLKRGPGHYPDTALPGQVGNASIAGHRTTYGQPFFNVDKLANGDQIIVKTVQGEFVYAVDATRVVRPNQTEVLLPTRDASGRPEARITLTACEPKYSAARRIIVSGLLVGKPAPALSGQADAQARVVAEQAREGRGVAQPATIDGGLSGVAVSKVPVIVWALVCVAIWVATWSVQVALRRRVRRRGGAHALSGRRRQTVTWTPYLVGGPAFLVALYVFFENFARLLPGNY